MLKTLTLLLAIMIGGCSTMQGANFVSSDGPQFYGADQTMSATDEPAAGDTKPESKASMALVGGILLLVLVVALAAGGSSGSGGGGGGGY